MIAGFAEEINNNTPCWKTYLRDCFAQQEHTIVVTDGGQMILTEMNEIWN